MFIKACCLRILFIYRYFVDRIFFNSIENKLLSNTLPPHLRAYKQHFQSPVINPHKCNRLICIILCHN